MSSTPSSHTLGYQMFKTWSCTSFLCALQACSHSSDRRPLVSLCPPVRMYQRGFHWTVTVMKINKRPANLFNPLNTELNPICHLLALLGAHPILHISRIRFKIVQNFRNLYEDLSTLSSCRRRRFIIKAFLCNSQYFYIVDINM